MNNKWLLLFYKDHLYWMLTLLLFRSRQTRSLFKVLNKINVNSIYRLFMHVNIERHIL